MPVGNCSSQMKNALCGMLVGLLDQSLNKISMVKIEMRRKVQDIERALVNLIPAVPQDILDAIDAVDDFEIPKLDELDNLKCLATFVENCSYLSRNSLLNNVAGVTSTLIDYFNANLQADLVSMFPDLSEFSISWDLSLSNDFISGFGIDTVITDANDLIMCISSLCGTDISDKVSQLSTYLSDMSLTSTGTLDLNSIFNRTNVPGNSRDAITGLLNSITGKKTEINTSVENGIEATRGEDYSSLVTDFMLQTESEFEMVIVGADLIINRIELSIDLPITTTISGIIDLTTALYSESSLEVTLSEPVLDTGCIEILSSTSTLTVTGSGSLNFDILALNGTSSIHSLVEPRLEVS